MGRRVIPPSEGYRFRAAGNQPSEAAVDVYKDRLVKYIPADIVAVYVTLSGIVRAAGDQVAQATLQWGVFGVILILTPFYLRRVTSIRGAKTPIKQIVVSTLAFIVWAIALPGGPFSLFSWFRPVYGALLIPLYTFIVAGLVEGDPL